MKQSRSFDAKLSPRCSCMWALLPGDLPLKSFGRWLTLTYNFQICRQVLPGHVHLFCCPICCSAGMNILGHLLWHHSCQVSLLSLAPAQSKLKSMERFECHCFCTNQLCIMLDRGAPEAREENCPYNDSWFWMSFNNSFSLLPILLKQSGVFLHWNDGSDSSVSLK